MRIKGFALPPRIPGAVLDSTIGRGFCPEAARRLGDHADENDATARTSPSALGRPRGSLPTWSDFASHRMWDASSKLPSGKWATLDSTRRSERALYRPSADSDVEGLAQAQPRNEAAPQVRVPTDCALDRPPLARQEKRVRSAGSYTAFATGIRCRYDVDRDGSAAVGVQAAAQAACCEGPDCGELTRITNEELIARVVFGR